MRRRFPNGFFIFLIDKNLRNGFTVFVEGINFFVVVAMIAVLVQDFILLKKKFINLDILLDMIGLGSQFYGKFMKNIF